MKINLLIKQLEQIRDDEGENVEIFVNINNPDPSILIRKTDEFDYPPGTYDLSIHKGYLIY